MTFLAIQEPSVSKFCSLCGTEFLDISDDREEEEATADAANGAGKDDTGGKEQEESEKGSLSLYERVIEFFDTCPYCGGKFRDS